MTARERNLGGSTMAAHRRLRQCESGRCSGWQRGVETEGVRVDDGRGISGQAKRCERKRAQSLPVLVVVSIIRATVARTRRAVRSSGGGQGPCNFGAFQKENSEE